MSSGNETSIHYRTCHLCEAMCGVAIEHDRDGNIHSIKGDPEDVLSRGHICPKAVALQDIQHDPDRLRRPVKRTGDRWEEISWSEALDIFERNIKRIRREHGREAVGFYIGNPTAHQPGALLMLGPLLAALGTRSRFSASSVDQLAVMFATGEMFGNPALTTVPDLDRTDFLLMIGANPAASNGSLMSAGDPMGRIRAISRRGGQVIAIDPRHTETARKADRHHFIRPGTDVFLLAAMLQVLFEEDLADPGRLAAFSDGLDELRDAVREFTPETVTDITGIGADEIRALAREFAAAERAVCYGRIGSNVQEFGGLTAWLIYALNAVTGNMDREGGAMFTQPAIDVAGLGGALGAVDGLSRHRTRVRQLPIFAGEKPVAAMAEEMQTPGEGRIRALVTHAGNPVLSIPNGRELDRALEGLDFMACIDIYLNETTRHADLILPPTGPLEHGHFDLLLNAWAVRNVVKYSPPLYDPPDDALHDWQIMLELTVRLNSDNAAERLLWRGMQTVLERLGMEGMLDWLLRAGPYGYRSKALSRLDRMLEGFLLAGRLYRRGRSALRKGLKRTRARHLLRASGLFSGEGRGLDLDEVRRHPHGVDLGPLRAGVLPDRLFTPDRRLRLAPELFLADLGRARQRLGETPAPDELRLIGRRHLRSNNSWMHNAHRLIKGKERCTLLVHPDDAQRLGLEDGGQARVSSRTGAIELPVEVTAEVMPGVVCIPHGFGHDRPGVQLRTAQQKPGVSVNDITDERFLDELTGVTALNGLPVEVTALSSAPGKKQRKRTEESLSPSA